MVLRSMSSVRGPGLLPTCNVTVSKKFCFVLISGLFESYHQPTTATRSTL